MTFSPQQHRIEFNLWIFWHKIKQIYNFSTQRSIW